MRLKAVAIATPIAAGLLIGLISCKSKGEYSQGKIPSFKGKKTLVAETNLPKFDSISHLDLRKLPVKERKKEFIKIMLPLIERANREILKERAFILKVKDKKELSEEERERLNYLMKKYKAKSIKELLVKVNTVPPGLVLAQAAVESGWGTSRFFREANNAFGIYTFKGKECLKAKESMACLKKYSNLYQSVKDYMYNLNVGWAYGKFRKLRNEGADIYTLIESLNGYSERKDDYTKLVEKVIKKNGFDSLSNIKLASNSSGLH
ncbi:glucosaminidase domain-containing protein [Thermovibrio sp.]